MAATKRPGPMTTVSVTRKGVTLSAKAAPAKLAGVRAALGTVLGDEPIEGALAVRLPQTSCTVACAGNVILTSTCGGSPASIRRCVARLGSGCADR